MLFQTIILIIGLIGARGIEVPDAVVVIDQYGVIIEPESLMLTYDNSVFTTVVIDMDLVVNPTKVDSYSSTTSCQLTDGKKKLLKHMEDEMSIFMETIPSRFNPLTHHICKGTKIDCMLASNEGKMMAQDLPPHRHKRDLILTVAAVAGLASAGVGIYNIFNDNQVSSHIESVQEQVGMIEEKLASSYHSQAQYQKISENLFLKIAFGFQNLRDNMRADICQTTNAFNEHLDSLLYSVILEDFKMKFNAALDGQVTDFLVTPNFLRTQILSRPEFVTSVYRIDPGLFYTASSSIMYKLDTEKKIAYFLINTPIINERDVSPIYSLHNLGWSDGLDHLQLDLPLRFSYLIDNSKSYIVDPDLSRCVTQFGVYICRTSHHEHKRKEICLEELLYSQTVTNCKTLIQKQPDCVFRVLKSGIAIQNCAPISTISSIRSTLNQVSISPSSNKFDFWEYGEFNQLLIQDNMFSTKTTIYKIYNKTVPTLELDLQDIRDDGLIGEILTSIDELKAVDKALPFYKKKLIRSPSATMIFVIFFLLAVGVFFGYYKYTRIVQFRAHSEMDQQLAGNLERLRRERMGGLAF